MKDVITLSCEILLLPALISASSWPKASLLHHDSNVCRSGSRSGKDSHVAAIAFVTEVCWRRLLTPAFAIDVSKEGAILKRSPNRKPSDINASVSDESSTIKGRLQSEHRNLETCGVKPFRVVWATTRYDPII